MQRWLVLALVLLHLPPRSARAERRSCPGPAGGLVGGESIAAFGAAFEPLPRASCPVAAQPEPGTLQPLDQVVAAEPLEPPRRSFPWLVAGGGALATALGLAIASDAAALPACASPEQGRACMSAPIDPGPVLGRAAAVSAAVGMVVLATGAVIESRDRDAHRAAPWIDGGAIGMAWTGEL
jgi:hypothetical protein